MLALTRVRIPEDWSEKPPGPYTLNNQIGCSEESLESFLGTGISQPAAFLYRCWVDPVLSTSLQTKAVFAL